MKIRPFLRFSLHAGLAAVVLMTVPWLLGTALAATGAAPLVPPPGPDAIAAYLTAYGPLVGALTVAYVLVGWGLRRWASNHWLAQGKRLAWATALVGVAGTALQAYVSGTPVSGVIATAVLGVLHIADATVAPARAAQSGRVTVVVMAWIGMVGLMVLAVAGAGCGASQRETTIRTSVAAADTVRDSFLAYDGPHELELARSGPPTPEGKAAAAAAIAAYQAKRSATIDKAFIAAYRAIAIAATLNDQPSLDGIKAAIDQLTAAYKALKGTTP